MTDLELGEKRAKQLGLEHPSKDEILLLAQVYRADDIHRLLGEAYKVGGSFINANWVGGIARADHHTHNALLIGIRPIVQETQESEERKFLRRFVKESEEWMYKHPLYLEAKRLLEGEKLYSKGESK